jgi:hypothetical protein
MINGSELRQNALLEGRLVLYADRRVGQSPEHPDTREIYSPDDWNNKLYANVDWWTTLRRMYGDAVLTIQTDTLLCGSMQFIPMRGPGSTGPRSGTWAGSP